MMETIVRAEVSKYERITIHTSTMLGETMIRKMSTIGFAVALIFASAEMAFAWPVPDTGQTKCYDNSGEIPCPEPGEAFYGQDGNYTINPPSYTKLGQNGVELPDDATSWIMVRDNVTSLIWEVKQNKDGVQDYSNPHDADNTYTWYDRNPETNGGNAGTPGDGTDTEDFINALNTASFGGFSDWRLPTPKELRSIVDYGRIAPAIRTMYFCDEIGGGWSSTTLANQPSFAWYAGLYDEAYMKALSRNVRAVRDMQGGAKNSLGDLIDHWDATISDRATGLMWQKQDDGQQMSWESSLSYCENLSLAGYEDWRLPNAKELDSIIDLGRYNPSISPLFAQTQSSFYWSSTTQVYNTNCAWIKNFAYGDYGGGANSDSYKSNSYYVRCVRTSYNTLPGDVNADGQVDLSDAIAALRVVTNQQAGDSVNISADVNANGRIGVEEAIYAIQAAARLRLYPTLHPIGSKFTDEGSLLAFTLSASDPEGDALTFSVTNLPDGGTFDAAAQSFTWTPTYSQSGVYHVTFIVTDTHGYTDSETVTITVNDRPLFNPIGNKSVDEGSTLSFTVNPFDPQGGPLTYAAFNLPDGAIFNPATRTFSWTPNYSQSGTYYVTFVVTDALGYSDSEIVTIIVSDKVPLFNAPDYLPLQVGNWWDYRDSYGDIERTRVSGTRSIGGVVTSILLYNSGEEEYYTSDANGVKLFGVYDPDLGADIIFNTPLLLAPNNAVIGGAPHVSSSSYYLAAYGVTVDITSTFRLLSLENVTTTGRVLKDCVRASLELKSVVRETGQMLWETTDYWLYKGVGVVKQVKPGINWLITQAYVNGNLHSF